MQSTMAARVVAVALAVLSIVIRLASNVLGAYNFNPIGALGVFGGARLKSWQAFVLPFAAMVGTDLSLAYYFRDEQYSLLDASRLWVYGCFALYVVIGRFVIGESKSSYRIVTASFLGAAQFFLITNFFEWLRLPYSKDVSGLFECYAKAIPFSLNTLVGDAIFTPLAFAAEAVLTRSTSADESLESATAFATGLPPQSAQN